MTARYLLRFDDICPTMDWAIWEQVEQILIATGARPLLAVVPDNRDPELCIDPPRADFWARVRHWQSLGWAIGLHGHRHRYETRDAGLVGINTRSEFAGLGRELQAGKLRQALAIFRQHGVRADAWVAPGHSFDAVTVELLAEMGLGVISDGYFWRPVRIGGCLWVPQQLWRFRHFPGGSWTVCMHANTFRERDLDELKRALGRFRSRLVSLDDVMAAPLQARPPALADRAFAWLWRSAIKGKRWIGQVRSNTMLDQ